MTLQLDGLGFAYAGKPPVLRDISLSIEGGGFVVFTGPSACGKTTLLKLLLDTPWMRQSGTRSGTMTINGHEPQALVKEGRVAYLSQNDSLFPNLTLLDNLRLPFMIRGGPLPPDFAELVAMADLAAHLSHYPGELSGGTRKRGEMVRAFLTRPSLVLLDEPFSKQDIRRKTSLYRHLLSFQEMTGALVILVTHDLMEAVLLSNRIIVMSGGGRIQKEMLIEKPLPRILAPGGIAWVDDELAELQAAILGEPAEK